MSYNNPTPLEILISQKLRVIANSIETLMRVEFKTDDFSFFLWVTPKSDAERGIGSNLDDVPVANYVANIDRQSAAVTMTELITKWQVIGDLPPIHEIVDAKGTTIKEAVKRAQTDTPEMNVTLDGMPWQWIDSTYHSITFEQWLLGLHCVAAVMDQDQDITARLSLEETDIAYTVDELTPRQAYETRFKQ